MKKNIFVTYFSFLVLLFFVYCLFSCPPKVKVLEGKITVVNYLSKDICIKDITWNDKEIANSINSGSRSSRTFNYSHMYWDEANEEMYNTLHEDFIFDKPASIYYTMVGNIGRAYVYTEEIYSLSSSSTNQILIEIKDSTVVVDPTR